MEVLAKCITFDSRLSSRLNPILRAQIAADGNSVARWKDDRDTRSHSDVTTYHYIFGGTKIM